MKPLIILLLITLSLCPERAAAQYRMGNAFPHLTFQGITDIQNAGDGTNRLFVTEKQGVIWVFSDDGLTPVKQEFLDIRGPVLNSGEGGLLGLAFHNDFETNGYFYVCYITTPPHSFTVVRYTVSGDPNVADANSDVEIIKLDGSSRFHNGGQLSFGDDGYLCISVGDNTVSANAQDRTTLWGSILRIDIDATVNGVNYAIPHDNPYKENAFGYREEIFAYGFRNPWRFCIDHISGTTFVADVGEELYEEIDTLVAGGNYGWPLMEANDCFQPASCDTAGANIIAPYYVYDHSVGIAVIGGHIYRGPSLPELEGSYVYADYIAGKIWRIVPQLPSGRYVSQLASDFDFITTMGVGEDGELYIAGQNLIHRLVRDYPTHVDSPDATRALGRNFPNPFNPSTTIPYQLQRGAHVTLSIWNASGILVRTLELNWKAAGSYDVHWNGTDGFGRRAASGVYFYSLSLDGIVVGTRNMVLLK